MTRSDKWYRTHLHGIAERGVELRGDELELRWREAYRSLFEWLCVRRGVPDSDEVFQGVWEGGDEGFIRALRHFDIHDLN